MRRLRYTTSCLLLLLSPLFLYCQCLKGDCQEGEGVLVLPNGSRYIGAFQSGKPTGEGMLFYTDRSRYVGEFSNGLPNGEGVQISPEGDRKSGKFRNGQLVQKSSLPVPEELLARGGTFTRTGCISGNCQNGQGTYIMRDGAIYTGEFSNGEIHGNGVCYYRDGSRYHGEWRNRRPDGQGTKIWPDGRRQSGRWSRGLPVDQYGNVLLPTGRVTPQQAGLTNQSGCIKGNCQEGNGTRAYPDGSRYQGTFRKGKPHGSGRFDYPNGDTYIGQFENGLPHGQGTRTNHLDKSQTNGRWVQGEFIPKILQRGCVEGDCLNGTGTFIYGDGSRYIGHFRAGKAYGQGQVYYKNGDRYEGSMRNNEIHGFGTYFYQDGRTLRGQWNQNAFVGGSMPEPAPNKVRPVNPADERKNIKMWAVVIGISDYDHMPVLRYPDDDAYRIYAFLKSPEGGAIPDERLELLIDDQATKSNIKNTMRRLFSQAGPNDLIFVYFSGHGLPGAFLPIDYDGFENQLFHKEFRDILDQSQAKYKLCLADACHSGSLLAAKGGDTPSLLSKYYETLAQARPGTALIMSSKSNETSLESSGLRQGVFSHYIIRGLKGEADQNLDRIVNVQELYNYVSRNVRAYTSKKQSPMIQGDYDPMMTISVIR